MNILFLQGPLGPFFNLLAAHFSSMGHDCHKINFNGGDKLYSGADHIVDYSGTCADWPEFLRDYIERYKIDSIAVYGDCRLYHKAAHQVSLELGLNFWAFEEGYLRSGFVTLELGGCNANSLLFNNIEALPQIDCQDTKNIQGVKSVGSTFGLRAWFAGRYYFAMSLSANQFASYAHHRPWTTIEEAVFWIKSLAQKWWSKLMDPPRYRRFIRRYDGQFFLLPLQVEVDFQLRDHSRFESVEQVIIEVLGSFSAHASSDQALLIKHHPQNRGFVHYGDLIDKLVSELGLEGRVLYGHDFNLPDVYRHVKGVVTVNSTVGLSALLHHLPTVVLGKSIYDIHGLTYEHGLDRFWRDNYSVDQDLFARFRTYLCLQTQVPGDFYKNSAPLVASAYQKITAQGKQ
ncbi:capsule biosynthesis protein [Shewanella violacea]|uniref:Capsule polysacchride export protein KpsS n=1 Tax=Shewanella violacea (strain JCM 10179 / CIP 106290 / LMG 19151 / DSS12) TaxID=637905 RepID=D4ZG00_SHEVD|nr:capsular biosynthesis protein [Shewanella violacea]BAJ00599.1 capsule polysacchride export protein KpsS [Shewanella violacea DSS12]